jgi:hypothetical protein
VNSSQEGAGHLGAREAGGMMLCRVAEDVLWMSRYVELALAMGR